MDLYLHDANVNDPVTGNMRAPTHAGTMRDVIIEHDYQLEMHLDDIFHDHKHIVRIESSDGRWWKRGSSHFEPEVVP